MISDKKILMLPLMSLYKRCDSDPRVVPFFAGVESDKLGRGPLGEATCRPNIKALDFAVPDKIFSCFSTCI